MLNRFNKSSLLFQRWLGHLIPYFSLLMCEENYRTKGSFRFHKLNVNKLEGFMLQPNKNSNKVTFHMINKIPF